MIGNETPMVRDSKPKEPLEKVIVDKIKKAIALKWPKAYFFKVHGGKFQQKGVPDIIGCIDGLFFAIEVKRPSERLNVSTLQDENIRAIINAGGIAFVSWDAKDAVDLLENKLENRKVVQGSFY